MCPPSAEDTGDGFFARWSRRKAQVRQGEQLTEPARPAPLPAPSPAAAPAPAPAALPPPTLDDLASINPLDACADFSRFVQPEVDPALKNAALKKLFTDPHFNVMDGLDVYIDDYSQPDPLPPGMLEQLQLGEYLGLREPAAPTELTPELSEPPAPASPEPAPSPDTSDENADLRLQPHDAAGRPRPEPGAGPDAGRLG